MNAQQQNRISRKRQGNLWDIGCIIQIKSKKCNKNKIRWRSHAWPKQNSLWIGTGRILIGSEKQKKKESKWGAKWSELKEQNVSACISSVNPLKVVFVFPCLRTYSMESKFPGKVKGWIDNVKSCEELLVVQMEEGKNANWFLNSQAIHRWVVAAKRVKKCCL